ncbi:MAG: polyamine aminopropyltransferase [Cytophagales bacterium]|nr:MAG: polyamine aminopropyltransferase [Cytophagales bacterium]TAF60395.1 MAG: polyamine aminopropyltransferase [Cytophagales bacterium]
MDAVAHPEPEKIQTSKGARHSQILKIALFATGLAGIVAEYILSTLATYFLGDSVFQWTMVLSLMLFAMGLGSRVSKHMDTNLLEKFILAEFALSILTSFSASLTYVAASYTDYLFILIYSTSIGIGLLIGMEIPLVMRINNSYETLKVNISSVMEKDYYGSLIGGLFFAFVGVPYLGLTYTPFVLGIVNFLVAVVLLYQLRELVSRTWIKPIVGLAVFIMLLLGSGVFMAKEIILYGEQKRYTDKVIYEKLTRYQQIVITEWKNKHWLYLNNHQQLSTVDEWLYHEPLVHPVMGLSKTPFDVLVLGGGDGCAVREVLKYPQVRTITLVDLDPEMTKLGLEHPVMRAANKDALHNPKVKILNQDAYTFLTKSLDYFDVMIIDFPDPQNADLSRLYSLEFFKLCQKQLRPQGVLITQSGSPYYAPDAFKCIERTIASAGFNTIPIHNQVLTMGEWGWIIGAKGIAKEQLKPILQQMTFKDIPTRWLNHDAMQLITSFGKDLAPHNDSILVNTIHNPILHTYYNKGNWALW